MAPTVRGELGRGHAGGGRAHGQVPRQWGAPLRSYPHAYSKLHIIKPKNDEIEKKINLMNAVDVNKRIKLSILIHTFASYSQLSSNITNYT